MARAVIVGVISRRAVSEVSEAELTLDRLERVEQLLFAVEAAVGVVPCVGVEL